MSYGGNMKKIVNSPHDKFFKATMTDRRVAKEFFINHLPTSMQKIVDLNKLKLCDKSFIDENLRHTESDVIFSTTFNKKPGYLFLLVEHQRTPDKLMPFRMLKYMISLMDQHLDMSKEQILPTNNN